MTKHTDTSRSGDLVAKLRDEDSYYRLQEKHWCIDAEELERQRLAAADRIEELQAALKRIADFGQANPGHGRSCAVIALRALVGDERD